MRGWCRATVKTDREPRTDPLPSTGVVAPASLVAIRTLKDFVLARLPEDHPLRAVILAERDVLTAAEFLAKMEVWAVLLNRRS